jgi:D-alanine-D-alanine ligase
MRVLVVFGGPSWEREGSVISASDVARSLDRLKIENHLCEFDRRSLFNVIPGCDFVFNSIHGQHGEDGTLASICEAMGVKYNFSTPIVHALSFDKLRLKMEANLRGLNVPSTVEGTFNGRKYLGVPTEKAAKDKGYILKPIFGGGSRGIQFIECGEQIEAAVDHRDGRYDPYFVEEFIEGSFVTCAMTGNGRVDRDLPLLQVEFGDKIYDYRRKHDVTKRQYIVPANVDAKVAKQIKDYCKELFFGMDYRPVVRFDFIVRKSDQKAFFLEANTVPGLSRGGNLVAIWRSTGRSYDDLIRFLVKGETR